MRFKINFTKITMIYIFAFFIVTMIYLMKIPANEAPGEFDDYTLMSASIINDHNFTISQSDVKFAQKLFPQWSDWYQNYYVLSPYYAKNGDQLSWYAPTYSIYCIPFIYIMKWINLSTNYAYRIANLVALTFSLLCLNRIAKMRGQYKFLLVLGLSLHPMLFLLDWPSAESFIFAMLILSLVFWMNDEYHKAALFCSIAGTLNIVIMFWGMLMILWFFIKLNREKGAKQHFIPFYLSRIKQIFIYGCCYIISILPPIFNFYQIGNINISGAEMTEKSLKPIIDHFIAYFLDLNFGFLPYFIFFLFIDLVVLYFALKKRVLKYIFLLIAMCGITFGYSIVFHINCGMVAISRYNAWNSVFLIITAVYGIEELIDRKIILRIASFLIALGVLMSFYVSKISSSVNYTSMLPLASYVLDNYPGLYNPLFSTFNSRVNHIDGGYKYKLPIIYYDKNNFVRKILVDTQSKSNVESMLTGNKDDMEWLEERLNSISSQQYISVGKKFSLEKVINIKKNETIWLSGEKWDASDYIMSGISFNEQQSTWTDGSQIVFNKIKAAKTGSYRKLIMKISIAGVYNRSQEVIIESNGKYIYKKVLNDKSEISVPLSPNENGIVSIIIKLPNAISPKELGYPGDPRKLALRISKVAFVYE